MRDLQRTTRTQRILIIDDDSVHRRLMENELQQQYELVFAADSENGLAHIYRNQFPAYDLVIVDLRLPAKVGELATTQEGFKILQALQQGYPSTPVVVVSAHMVDRTRKQAEDLGVKRIFEKPFSPRGF